MSEILLISGSPTAPSKSAALLSYSADFLRERGITVKSVSVRDFPAEDLIQANYASPAFTEFKADIERVAAIVVATPIYKAAYTGSLKALLDILPQGALRGKTILPLATGGTHAHQLAIDYALKPVLAVLGASDIQQGVYIVDNQFQTLPGGFKLDAELQTRLDDSLERLYRTVEALDSNALSV
ncbi:MAG: reductase [Akkermansiaceae bacterium]|nr:reductase [Akkermansiaceae bacterium]